MLETCLCAKGRTDYGKHRPDSRSLERLSLCVKQTCRPNGQASAYTSSSLCGACNKAACVKPVAFASLSSVPKEACTSPRSILPYPLVLKSDRAANSS